MSVRTDVQARATDPRASAFLTAHAGSGKTSTLVDRVARLLLTGSRPQAILCVTYTRAAAAEMQRRLIDKLGKWAVMDDHHLAAELAEIGEAPASLREARALFARALETPGGLQIQTLHAFCERLLRRFPLEAGVSPGFVVLESQAAAEISAEARKSVARAALARPDHALAQAYAHFSIQLHFAAFEAMFAEFENRRRAIAHYVERTQNRVEADVWRRCGFDRPTMPDTIRAAALQRTGQLRWRRAAAGLAATGKPADAKLAERLIAVAEGGTFEEVADIFVTQSWTPRKSLGSRALDSASRAWLDDEQRRLVQACEDVRAAQVATDTCHALTLAIAYIQLYEGAKTARRALDFGDLIDRTVELLSEKADAAWVLYKLDGGLEHVLLDEAQDTAPEQWDVLRALTGEFFTGIGSRGGLRTLFAVADEKQSIFSFQGAAPERFGKEQEAFRAMISGSGASFFADLLKVSRRSRPEVLGFVDGLYRDPEALAGLVPEGALALPLSHLAERGAGGCVEFWPLEVTEEAIDPDPWRPVDAPEPESANRKLARRIARTIKAMVARGEGVGDRSAADEARPCVYGDFLILVRRRAALFHEIIRALKREGVPAGGADRLRLSAHGLYDDLMALARFARFPADDLTLAALLRSPFADLTEDDLFDLAHGRTGRLWTTLRRRAEEKPRFAAPVAFLEWAIEQSGRTAPFDFFNRALSRLDRDGRSMRQRILTRLGSEAEDALESFLAEAAGAEGRAVWDLETFLARMESTDLEVTREQGEGQGGAMGEVRVMTVHGAKGLEAPIVILPDTTTRATAQSGPLLAAEDGFLWASRKADDCPASAAARDARDRALEHESLRLLYVAATRARDRLIIAGVEVKRLTERSWRDYVDRAAEALKTHPFALEGGGEGRRFGADPIPARAREVTAEARSPLPAWASALAAAEAALATFAAPSSLGETSNAPAPSPLESVGGLGRYRRGELIHRLLQILPDVPGASRQGAARRLLAREFGLTDEQRAEMAAAALAVLADRRFADVFGPGSRAEVPLAGATSRLPAGLAISGRVDRLLVQAGRVLVVDFKTNRPAPARIEAVDKAYITQMAVYAAILAEIFPGRTIEAALVWTDGPRLMPVPEKLITTALDDLGRIG